MGPAEALGPEREAVSGTFTVRMWVRVLSKCARPAGRAAAEAVSRGQKSRGRFSLIVWPSDSGKKICQSNVAIADAMGEAFVASDRAFMPFHDPK